MNTLTSNQTAAGSTPGCKHIKLKSEGKWKTFPKQTGLRLYVPSGVFSMCIRVNKVLHRESLETTDKETALTLLAKRRQELLNPTPKAAIGTVGDGRKKFEDETATLYTLAENTRRYRLRCVDRIFKSWAGLDTLPADQITVDDFNAWANRFAGLYAPQFFNNCLNVLREILRRCGVKRDDNPAWQVKRLGMPRKKLDLPTVEQFHRILVEIETAHAVDAKDRADYVRFLAFTGCRWEEATTVLWEHVDWSNGFIRVKRAKLRKTSSEDPFKLVPIIAPLRTLLEKLKQSNPKPSDRICKVIFCRKPLTRACKIVGCARLTHHSLRHLYATFCIESGVDIQTVSRWLGHSDGGALAMKVYGHGRPEHFQAMAKKVTFGLPPLPEQPKQLEAQTA